LLLIVTVIINNHDTALIGISPFFFTHGYYINLIGLDKASQLQDVLTPPGMAGEMFMNCLWEATD
jgi:S-ribosylhomocysteine lyase LuxS involved in autoinducer biosynthesis